MTFNAEKFATAPVVKSVMCREVDVLTRVVPRVVRDFTSDLMRRKPKGGNDVDLLTFLVAIASRNAVVVLPEYHNTRPTQRKADELVLPANRHGRMIAVVSNAKTFRFSIRVLDANVMTASTIGAPRTFTLTDSDGKLATNWSSMMFMPTAEENRFLRRYGLVGSDGSVPFTRTVHPNRWTSMFGRTYVLAKILLDRLSDEIKHWLPQRRSLLADLADEREGDYRSRPEPVAGRKVKVQAFETKVPHDVFLGEYPLRSDVTERLSALRVARERVQVATRAIELAYVGAIKRTGSGSWPAPSGVLWREFRPPKARTTWHYTLLGGDYGIQARLYETTETVKE